MEQREQYGINGKLQVSAEAIKKVCKLATLEVEGVSAVAIGNTGVKGVASQINALPAIEIELVQDTAIITINVIVTPAAKIHILCEEVQQNVKRAVQNITGIVVSKINVVIAGIS